jgi:hypothetical protein
MVWAGTTSPLPLLEERGQMDSNGVWHMKRWGQSTYLIISSYTYIYTQLFKVCVLKCENMNMELKQ